jgi:hypothetical protein
MVSLSLPYRVLASAILLFPNRVCKAFQLQRWNAGNDLSQRHRAANCLNVIRSDQLINGESKSKIPYSFLEGIDVAALPEGGELLPPESSAPPMSFNKFLTMQEKRAVVTIRYSGDAGLKPYFLTLAKKLKASHPDIVIERLILPAVADGNEATFEVLVDGKVVMGKSRPRKVTRGVVDMHMTGRRSIYVSMGELDLAISRARRKHRPSTVYGDDGRSKANLKAGGGGGNPSPGSESTHGKWTD